VPTSGTGDLTFTRASTATRTNESGVIESVASNVPRLDYSGGGFGKLLLEPQRTNLQTQSNGFLSNWTKNDVTTSVGESTLISGETTTLITETATNAVHRVVSVGLTTFNIGSVYTISLYAKSNGSRNIGFRTGFTGSSVQIIFNPNTQTAVSVPAGFTTNITAANNGYYRYSITATAGAAIDLMSVVMFDGTSLVYTGTTQSIYISAIQTELGAYPTTYIPTTTAAVTRLADDASKTGVSSLIGQTEGTIYFEFDYKKNQINTALFQTSLGIINTIYVLCLSDFKLRFLIYLAGVAEVVITTATIPNSGFNKLAVAYKSNDSAFYLNGIQIGVDNSCSIPTVSSVYLTTANQNTQAFMTFRTRLTNAQLAEITTL
jgi:hypothetical protein